MKVLVLDPGVQRNLTLFRHIMHRQSEKRSRFFHKAKKTYRAFVSCDTGELFFQDLFKDTLPPEHCRSIVIQLRPDQSGAFEVVSPEHGEYFECEGFSKEAYALFTKTLHILNQISYDPTKQNNPFWVLRQVAHLEFLLPEQAEGRRNLVYEAWHAVNRLQAEKLLKNSPPGTYLFRKGEFCVLFENELNESLSEPIECITLTYRSFQDKICEKTLVCKNGKWRFYNDDIDFDQPGYDSVKLLLDSMKEELSEPLRSD